METAALPVTTGTRKVHRKRHLRPEQVLDVLARDRRGEHREDIAKRYGITTSQIGHIACGRCWSGTTGIRRATTPNERHAEILLRQIVEDPQSAPAIRSKFDDKFGPGAAVKVVRRVLQADAR